LVHDATLSYDANGNLTNNGTNTYGWNARNQLSSMTGGVSASFLYDAKNRRTNRTVISVSVGYLHDGDNPVQEITSSATNIWAGGTDEFFQRGNQTLLRGTPASACRWAEVSPARPCPNPLPTPATTRATACSPGAPAASAFSVLHRA
jgi:hypothetical protein